MTQATNQSSLLGWLYGVPALRGEAQKRDPDAAVLLASGAMLVHKSTPDDRLQRVTSNARRGAFVVSTGRLVFATQLFMPMNILFMSIAAISIGFWFGGGGLPAAILAAFGVAWVVRRRPYRLELPLDAVDRVTVAAVEGMTGGYHTLIIHSRGEAYQVVTTDVLDAATRDFLLTIGEGAPPDAD